MKDFEFYINEGKIKKQTPDINLAKSLKKDALERINQVKQLNIDFFSKLIYENTYDALRDILDAILTINGYKSYSHEGSISFLKTTNINIEIIEALNEFRYKRNSSKYYGKSIDKYEAQEILEFFENYSELFLEILEKKLTTLK